MKETSVMSVERITMQFLIIALVIFAFWTGAHQIATFTGTSWANLSQIVAWILPVVVLFSYWFGAQIANVYVKYLPDSLPLSKYTPNYLPVLAGLLFMGISTILDSYLARYALLILCLLIMLILALQDTKVRLDLQISSSSYRINTWVGSTYLLILIAITVLIVLCVNRPDFDDAEYIQFAIQTLRYPEKGLYTFDASLGEVLEQFRFAPYRITSYETFIALVTDWTKINILDTYYLLFPAVSATLTVLVAFVFLRWFLPFNWTFLALLLFLLISFAWGETHVAFGNRMFVRLFQGKGLLVAVTTPLTILVSLMWMRKPSVSFWLCLLFLQIAAIGVSSSGLVITLFATVLGILAGLSAEPTRRNFVCAFIAGLTLVYPMGWGLWIKYLSSATGKVEEIGSYLPINASFGGTWREALSLTILITASFIASKAFIKDFNTRLADKQLSLQKVYFGIIFFCFLFVLNPLLINIFSSLTSKNMNWRLAWATPIPLLLSISLIYITKWSIGDKLVVSKKIWLFPLTLVLAFAFAGPWTLFKSNKVNWGLFEHKLPPEYEEAVDLAKLIRQQTNDKEKITVLVEPRVGTWLTVVAPDFRMVMPGHGYMVTLVTIMENKDFAQRNQLVKGINDIYAGDESYNDLLDYYKVSVIAVRTPNKQDNNSNFILKQR